MTLNEHKKLIRSSKRFALVIDVLSSLRSMEALGLDTLSTDLDLLCEVLSVVFFQARTMWA